MEMKDGGEYVARAVRLEYCPQWGEDAWSWTLRSDYEERIVRCRDCMHRGSVHFVDVGWHATRIIDCEAVDPNGFCAWGERMEDE